MLLAATALALLGGCASLPGLEDRTASRALEDTEATTALGRAVAPLVRAHPGQSGVLPLSDGRAAFAARSVLADAAERSLDIQYYIWRTDLSGRLLFDDLRRAADRGVRVRLLLDDNNTAGTDHVLAQLDAHPGIEVRLFNPFPHRRWRVVDYLTDFARVNRRMHNKSFTADNQVTIVGGRNVGDAYFDVGGALLFSDLDVLGVGPVVREVSGDFDRYWASHSSYPLDRMVGAVPPPAADGPPDGDAAADALAYRSSAAGAFVLADLLNGRQPLEWTTVRLVSDDPSKGLAQQAPDTQLPAQLRDAMGRPQRELQLVSSYFVPTDAGRDAFVGMARSGVDISVLTNSLEATDVPLVHAGYARHREALLAAGVKLFELKARAPMARRASQFSGSSTSSLHAKTFAVDGRRVFIGSFNLDPRSANLNTEMGFVIDSEQLARRFRDAFRESVPRVSYEVRLREGGGLRWLDREGEQTHEHTREPGTTFLKRLAIRVMSWLPIDWML